jgi:uncharacterized protein YjaG (DUF416 family)
VARDPLMIDALEVREELMEMAEDFDVLGFNKVLEDFEGSGRIAEAIENLDDEALEDIEEYLKAVAKELLEEQKEATTASGAKAVQEAKKRLDVTWRMLKPLFDDL